jgi:hypothetical protein
VRAYKVAARLYNVRDELRAIIEGEPCIAPIEHARTVQARLLAILDAAEAPDVPALR